VVVSGVRKNILRGGGGGGGIFPGKPRIYESEKKGRNERERRISETASVVKNKTKVIPWKSQGSRDWRVAGKRQRERGGIGTD